MFNNAAGVLDVNKYIQNQLLQLQGLPPIWHFNYLDEPRVLLIKLGEHWFSLDVVTEAVTPQTAEKLAEVVLSLLAISRPTLEGKN